MKESSARACMWFVVKMAGSPVQLGLRTLVKHVWRIGVREIHQRPGLTCVVVPRVPIPMSWTQDVLR